MNGHFLTPEWWRNLQQLWTWHRNIHVVGPGVEFDNGPTGMRIVIRGGGGSGRSSGGGGGLIWCLISSNATGGGKYFGKTRTAVPASVAVTGNLAAADIGTFNATEDILLLNTAEEAQGTHDLTSGTPVVKRVLAAIQSYSSTETPPKMVGIITAIDPENCT